MSVQQCLRCGLGPIVKVETLVSYERGMKHQKSDVLLQCGECDQFHRYILDTDESPPIKVVRLTNAQAEIFRKKCIDKCSESK